jgi:hypothetical protein
MDPTSQTYLDWYRGVNNKLAGTGGANPPKNTLSYDLDMKSKPTISHNSNRIIEQKRYGSSGSGFQNSANVHDRLH